MDDVIEDAPEGVECALPSGRTARIYLPVRPAKRGERVDLVVEPLSPGSVLRVSSYDPYAARAVARLEREAALSSDDARELVEDARSWLEVRREARARGVSGARHWRIATRLKEQPEAQARWHEIGSPAELAAFWRRRHDPETLAIWRDSQALAVLDVDWHGVAPPPHAEIERLAMSLNPQPLFWWRSRGGGLHAVYLPQKAFAADELATLAASEVLAQGAVVASGATVEVKAEIRHPGATHGGRSPGPVRAGDPDRHLDLSALSRWSRSGASEPDIDEVLADKGWALGARLDHAHCVIDPHHASSSPSPVCVTPEGLYCHSCAARHGDGFRSWAAVRKALGYDQAAAFDLHPIREAAEHFVHWTHVEYLFEGTDASPLPPPLRQTAYRALLKAIHDPSKEALRIEKVFHPWPFVRGEGRWLHADTLMPVDARFGKEDLSVLPSVLRTIVPQEGAPELVLDQPSITAHRSNGNLPGWRPLAPKRCVPIHTVHNRLGSDAVVAVEPRVGTKVDRVTYLHPRERVPMADAERAVLKQLPGIDMTYFKAIFLALGSAESRSGPVPMLWGSGVSGSAKSGTIKAVFSMLGEPEEDLGRAREDKLVPLFGEAVAGGKRAVIFDDFAKNEDRVELLYDFLLPLNRASFSFHMPYKGLTNIRCDTAVFLTDWARPNVFVDDVQMGRRVHYYELAARITPDWLTIGRSFDTWWRETPEIRHAVSSWYSHMVDEWFPETETPESFPVLMKRLGVPTLEQTMAKSDEQNYKELLSRYLVRILAHVPQAEIDASKRKKQPAGFMQFTYNARDDLLSAVMSALHDQIGGKFYGVKKAKTLLDSVALSMAKHFDFRPGVRPQFNLEQRGSTTVIRIAAKDPDNGNRMLVAGELFASLPPRMTLDILHNGEAEDPEDPDEGPAPGPGPQPASAAPPLRDGHAYHIDYETRSAVDLRTRGVGPYAADPSTRVLCAVVRSADLRDWYAWTPEPYPGLAEALATAQTENGWDALHYVHGAEWMRELHTKASRLKAFNCGFEATISEVTLNLPPVEWDDIMDMAAFHGLPGPRGGLEGMASELFGEKKDKEGQKVMQRLCKLQKGRGKRTGEVYFIEPTLADMLKLVTYCRKDVLLQSRAETEALGSQPHPDFEELVRRANTAVNRKGVLIDREFGETLLSFQNNLKTDIALQIEERTRPFGVPLVAADLTRVTYLLQWFNKHLNTYPTRQPLLGMTADVVEEFMADPHKWGVTDTSPGSLGEMLVDVAEARLIYAGSALSKVEKAFNTMHRDGRLRFEFQLYGAHTHRWTGRGVQLQNLKRPPEHELLPEAIKAVEDRDYDMFLDVCDRMAARPSDVLGGLIRAMIVPAPGHKFVVCDYTAVEARAFYTLAGMTKRLADAREDDREAALPKDQRNPNRMPDGYCRTAADLYGVPYVGKKDKVRRQAGKVSDLACQYGGGEGAVRRFGAIYKIDWQEAGLDPAEVARRWRRANPEAVDFWADLETAAKNAIRDKGRADAPWYWAGKFVAARAEGDDVVFRMPAGTILRYRRMRVGDDGLEFDAINDKSGRWLTVRTWGSRIAENVTQKVCRDIFAQDLVEVTDAGGEPPVMLVHDEMVCEVPDDEVQYAVEGMTQIMSTPPSWMPEMPLRGVAEVMRRYGK